jgi:O-antigen chain-terminating methyltransferase
VLDVVQHAYRALADGGQLVVETPNPQSLYVFARAFWLDPTHSKPVHPVYLDFVLRSAGFSRVEFEWTALPAAAERLEELTDESPLTKVINENARRVNDILFAAQNYRVTAYR